MAENETSDRFGWQEHAACRGEDVNVFFPLAEARRSSVEVSHAKQICLACPVLDACRTWSLEIAPEFGIFAALTGEERRVIRSTRRPRAASRPRKA